VVGHATISVVTVVAAWPNLFEVGDCKRRSGTVHQSDRPSLREGVPLIVASLTELDHLTLAAFVGDRKLRAEDGAGNP
jgi:hypothetical protein